MDPDLVFVIGIVIGGLSIPLLLAAFTDGRLPRAAILLILVSMGMIGFAVLNQPAGYPIAEIPNVFVDVIARYVR